MGQNNVLIEEVNYVPREAAISQGLIETFQDGLQLGLILEAWWFFNPFIAPSGWRDLSCLFDQDHAVIRIGAVENGASAGIALRDVQTSGGLWRTHSWMANHHCDIIIIIISSYITIMISLLWYHYYDIVIMISSLWYHHSDISSLWYLSWWSSWPSSTSTEFCCSWRVGLERSWEHPR